MTLFCDGNVIMPEHVHFPPDLNSAESSASVADSNSASLPERAGGSHDLSLASAVERHVRFVYRQANGNQRRAARLLGIARATLSRHLRSLDHK